MTIFSKISKKIGFKRRTITEYPTMEQAVEMSQKATEGDEYAFERLFSWLRFLRAPETPHEEAIYDIFEKGFKEAVPKFWVEEQTEAKDELSIL